MPDAASETKAAIAPIGLVLGRKGMMTQVYDEAGRIVPATVIEVGLDCHVVRFRTKDIDGYAALQLGFGRANEKRLRKPIAGHYKRSGVPPARLLMEVRITEKESKACSELKPGHRLTVGSFSPGDLVNVAGKTRGRGFAGGVERWNWSSGPRTHGSMSHRRIGSVGAGTSPGRVLKGRHLPGHYGNEQVTVKNLHVVRVEPEAGRLLISGAVPGTTGGVLLIRKVLNRRSEG